MGRVIKRFPENETHPVTFRGATALASVEMEADGVRVRSPEMRICEEEEMEMLEETERLPLTRKMEGEESGGEEKTMGVLMTRREVLLIHTPSTQLKSMDGMTPGHRVVGVGVETRVGLGAGVGVGVG